MKNLVRAGFIALAIGGGFVAATASVPAVAADRVAVQLDLGNIAFGYTDGYWDRNRQWHRWQSRAQATQFRAAQRAHYYNARHDRHRAKGWRDNDKWWDRH